MLCVSEDKVLRGVYWGFWRQTLSVWDAGVHACSGFSCGMRRWIPGIKFVVKGLRWKTFTFSLRRMIVSRQNCGTCCLKTSKFPTEKPWFIACFAWFWMCFSSPQRFFSSFLPTHPTPFEEIVNVNWGFVSVGWCVRCCKKCRIILHFSVFSVQNGSQSISRVGKNRLWFGDFLPNGAWECQIFNLRSRKKRMKFTGMYGEKLLSVYVWALWRSLDARLLPYYTPYLYIATI